MNKTEAKTSVARAYYQAMGKKDIAEVDKCIHPDVEFTAPLAKTEGKEAFLEGAKMFTTVFDTLSIHAEFEKNDKVVIVYDLSCPKPIGNLRAVAYMSFKEDLISSIELFYDPRPFLK